MDLCEVFLDGELVFENFFGDVLADEAEVPGFVVVAGNVFFAFRIAENKAEHGEFLVDSSEGFAVGDHLVVFALNGAVRFDDEDVDGESRVMFGIADLCEVFFAIFGSELRIC